MKTLHEMFEEMVSGYSYDKLQDERVRYRDLARGEDKQHFMQKLNAVIAEINKRENGGGNG